MKVIDLLNIIANGENIPYRIYIKNMTFDYIYYWDKEVFEYVEENNKEDVWGILDWQELIPHRLNDEVEIIKW